jgi:acyl-CoA thioester hydrolase
MARIRLELPATFAFQTDIPIRIGDINYGGHLGNDAVLSIVHEARVRFLESLGYSEGNIDGCAILMSDAVILYQSEGFYGDVLIVEVAVTDIQSVACDIVFRLTNAKSGKEIARAKTGIVFVDPTTKRIVAVPAGFRARFT